MYHYSRSYDTVELAHVRSLHLGTGPYISRNPSYLRHFRQIPHVTHFEWFECHYSDAKEALEAFAGEDQLRNLNSISSSCALVTMLFTMGLQS